MSKIKEFENIPDIDIEGEETLEEAVADCKALFGKYNKELFNGEVSLERCSEAYNRMPFVLQRSQTRACGYGIRT